MTPIHLESYGGSSLASGWNWPAEYSVKGSPFPTGISPISPNTRMLRALTGGGLAYYGTWQTLDGAGGAVAAWAYFNVGTPSGSVEFGVQIRQQSSSPGTGGGTKYLVVVSPSGSTVKLYNSATQLGSTVAMSGYPTPGWVRVEIDADASNVVSAYVQDYGSGNWLQPSGAWSSTRAACVSVADSSPITGQGYSGVYVLSPSDAVYIQNFEIDSLATTVAATMGAAEGRDVPSLSGGFAASGSIAKSEARDAPSMAGVQTLGSLARTEARDSASLSGGSTVGAMAATERRDAPSIVGGANHGILTTQEARDSAALSAGFGSPSSVAATESRDVPSLVAFANAGSMAAVERPDSPAISATFAAQAHASAAERRDVAAILGDATGRASLAAVEAGDRAAILATAAGVPPYFKVQERPDVASFAGVCETLHYDVYANSGAGDPIDYASPVAIATATAWASPWRLSPGTWGFGVRAANEWGEESNIDVAVTIVIDAAGRDATNIPASPIALSAVAIGGGEVRVDWAYPPTATRPPYPTGFAVYQGAGGAPSYSSPVATVRASWTGGLASYSATITGLADGVRYWFGVRAFNGYGQESNTLSASAVAKAVGPNAPASLTITATN